MKRSLLAVVVCLMGVASAFAEKPKANPAEYTVTVHVVFSRARSIDTVVDDQPMTMTTDTISLLVPGDYKARLIGKKSAASGYEPGPIVYEFLFPDGKIRDYTVIGLGLKGGAFGTVPGAAAQ